LLCAVCLVEGGCAGGRAPITDVQKAVDAGGTVIFPAGTYILTQTVVVKNSGTIVQGVGPETVFVFKPTQPPVHCVNDRAFTTPCDDESAPRRPITAPIAPGDLSFAAGGDVSDLRSGDWLIITEKDRTAGDVISIDWVQVKSISSQTVYVQAPFRTPFSTARVWDPMQSGLGFWKISHLTQGVQFRNLTIVVPDSGQGAPGISVFAALNTRIENVTIEDPDGQALYSYLSKGLTIYNSFGKGGQILNEFAATVDLNLYKNMFSSSNGVALGLDFGTAFFVAAGNTIPSSLDIGMYLLNGVHDGSVALNSFSLVNSGGIYNHGSAIGILARGTQHVNITNDYLGGGAGAASIGISIGPAYAADIAIPSFGNTVAPNFFGLSWGEDYDPSNSP